MCMSNIESHVPCGSLRSQGLFIGQIPQRGKETATALELFTHTEKHTETIQEAAVHISYNKMVHRRGSSTISFAQSTYTNSGRSVNIII